MLTPDNPYYAQVSLLVRVLPVVAREGCFALKGGTAINLFVRDLPRLSVDIDLAYLPVGERTAALEEIDAALGRIAASLADRPHGFQVRPGKFQEKKRCGLLVSQGAATIKIELSPVLRGCVYPAGPRRISANAEAEFGFAEVPVFSFADLYAGKIVAALDRQHPRDLFDVKLLLAAEGISDELFRAFLVYLISHDGSIARVLNPTLKPLEELYHRQFAGMTVEPVALAELELARDELIAALHNRLGESEKAFLRTFKRGEPQWELLGINHVADLPAVRWKMLNLSRMSGEKRQEIIDKLELTLQGI